jgi:signal transduction histidine kinase/CheY-like chemotaxis protein
MPEPANASALGEQERRVRVLFRMLRVMGVMGVITFALALFDRANDLRVTLAVYGPALASVGVVALMARRGRVVLAIWTLSIFFWSLVAFVTLTFGGLKGQHASMFAVSTLLVGSILGGPAAIGVAVVSSLWCAGVLYLETHDLLPWNLGTYTPGNAWTAATLTVVLTSVLLHESLTSLRAMHAEAQSASLARDEALRRTIQGQKMELVGKLTSGIAHDLNNLLTVIVGVTNLVRVRTAKSDVQTLLLLDDLAMASSRSTLLTSQLLAFGGKKAGKSEPVNVGKLVEGTGKLLPRLLGSPIEVTCRVAPDCWVWAERSAFEQIVLNLAVNARDAMPNGGKLEIAVDAVGDNVVLSVSDTGVGMSPEVQNRVFEPFFTTKPAGTGLGLATTRELTTRYQGDIAIESSPGSGTVFKLSFPRVAAPEDKSETGLKAPLDNQIAQSSPRIVLVEDDPLVRRALTRMLMLDGYEVTPVQDGDEALSLILTAPGSIACVVTDVSMRRMDGVTLALRLGELRPTLPVVIVSGNREPSPGVLQGQLREFLPKPVTHEALREAIVRLVR